MAKAKKSEDKTLWYALLVLLGVGILGVNLGIIHPSVVRFWPIILVIFGLLGLSGGLSQK